MTTGVINLRGQIHDFGPRLEDAPPDVVYVGRRWTLGGWDLPRHPLYNPFAHHTATKRRDGTRAEVMAMYRAYLLEHPELLELVPELRGRTLACWCVPELCHAQVLAELADTDDLPDYRLPARRSVPDETATGYTGHCSQAAPQALVASTTSPMALACGNRQ